MVKAVVFSASLSCAKVTLLLLKCAIFKNYLHLIKQNYLIFSFLIIFFRAVLNP